MGVQLGGVGGGQGYRVVAEADGGVVLVEDDRADVVGAQFGVDDVADAGQDVVDGVGVGERL
jgi:hypothetical protein